MYMPFVERSDYMLSVICQIEIFVVLLAAISLKSDPPAEQRSLIDMMLTVGAFVPPACAVYMIILEALDDFFDEEARERARERAIQGAVKAQERARHRVSHTY